MLLRDASVHLSASLGAAQKMLLADFCNQLLVTSTPTDRRIPEPRSLRCDRPAIADETSRGPPPTPQRPASDHLAAIRPRMSVRLTALTQLRPLRRELSAPRGGRRWATHFGPPSSSRCVRPRSRPTKKPLTPPVALRRSRRAFARRHLRRARTASTTLASTRMVFPAQGAFRPRVLRAPFRDLRARHRSRDFADALRLPTLIRLPDALAREG